jgi:hypothetical protein
MRAHRSFIRLVLFPCMITGLLLGQTAKLADNPAQPHVSRLTIEMQTVSVVHLRPGFVSSIRLPEEVSSVVLGNPLTSKAAETNALITTKTGHEIPLHLVSNGRFGGPDVDVLLEYERPHSFMIPAAESSFGIGETRSVNSEISTQIKPDSTTTWMQEQLLKQTKSPIHQWTGKRLQVAVSEAAERDNRMSVAFSVLNNSEATLELLPPQLRLAGPTKENGGHKVKAEPVPIDQYSLTARKLAPGSRADGVLLFERPQFKESSEQLLIQIVQADQVDRPVLVPISFTAPLGRTAQ